MKTKIFLATALSVALLSLLTACNKEAVQPSVAPENAPVSQVAANPGEPVNFTVTVTAPSPSTKTTTENTADEARIATIDILVFKYNSALGDFVIDSQVSQNGSGAVSITATAGTRRILAVVNTDISLASITAYNELKNKYFSLLAQKRNQFTMMGMVDNVELSPLTGNIEIPVSRIVSRIKLDKITNALENGGLANKTFQVCRVFLGAVTDIWNLADRTDVAYQQYYSLDGFGFGVTIGDQSVTGADMVAINNLIYNKLATPETVAHNASYETPFILYAFPNPGTSHPTKLYVELSIGGQKYLYPVPLPTVIGRNSSIEIRNLRIKHLGNPSDGDDRFDEGEDTPIEWLDLDDITVEVLDWDLTLVGDEGVVEL